MHSALPTCQPPFMVRSLQLFEVRPYAEEEEEEELEEEEEHILCIHFMNCLVDELSGLSTS